jgi:hypothetical protein
MAGRHSSEASFLDLRRSCCRVSTSRFSRVPAARREWKRAGRACRLREPWLHQRIWLRNTGYLDSMLFACRQYVPAAHTESLRNVVDFAISTIHGHRGDLVSDLFSANPKIVSCSQGINPGKKLSRNRRYGDVEFLARPAHGCFAYAVLQGDLANGYGAPLFRNRCHLVSDLFAPRNPITLQCHN